MDSTMGCKDPAKFKTPILNPPYTCVDQNTRWCCYDYPIIPVMLHNCGLGFRYINSKGMDESQWISDNEMTPNSTQHTLAEDKSDTKKNKNIREIPEMVSESEMVLQFCDSHSRNILIQVQEESKTDEVRCVIKQILEKAGHLRTLLNLDTGNSLAVYYDIRSSFHAHEMLNAKRTDNFHIKARFVDIKSLNTYFDICSRYYETDGVIDYDYIRNPDNTGKLQIYGLQSRVDPVIESIINMFGRTISVRNTEFSNSFGLEVEYCDIRSAQAAYDSLSECEYAGTKLIAIFCSEFTTESQKQTPLLKNTCLNTRQSECQDTCKPVSSSILKIDDTSKLVEESHTLEKENLHHKIYNCKTSFSSVAARTLSNSGRTVTCAVLNTLSKSATYPSTEKHSQCIVDTPESIPAAEPCKDVTISNGTLTSNALAILPPPTPLLGQKKPGSNLGNELSLENIELGLDKRTTFMIRNIPNKYTQCMLISFLNSTHKGLYDFLYLRMDFKNKCNVGYAFINFYNKDAIVSFVKKMMGRKWEIFNSDKICSLSYANIQGKRALINRFRNSSVMLKDPGYRPKVFYTSGSCAGEEAPFPGPSISSKRRNNNNFYRNRKNELDTDVF